MGLSTWHGSRRGHLGSKVHVLKESPVRAPFSFFRRSEFRDDSGRFPRLSLLAVSPGNITLPGAAFGLRATHSLLSCSKSVSASVILVYLSLKTGLYRCYPSRRLVLFLPSLYLRFFPGTLALLLVPLRNDRRRFPPLSDLESWTLPFFASFI